MRWVEKRSRCSYVPTAQPVTQRWHHFAIHNYQFTTRPLIELLTSFLNFLEVFLVMVIGSKGGMGTGATALLLMRLPPLLGAPIQFLRRFRNRSLLQFGLLLLGCNSIEI